MTDLDPIIYNVVADTELSGQLCHSVLTRPLVVRH